MWAEWLIERAVALRGLPLGPQTFPMTPRDRKAWRRRRGPHSKPDARNTVASRTASGARQAVLKKHAALTDRARGAA